MIEGGKLVDEPNAGGAINYNALDGLQPQRIAVPYQNGYMAVFRGRSAAAVRTDSSGSGK